MAQRFAVHAGGSRLQGCQHSFRQEVSPGPNSRSTWDSSLVIVVASRWVSCVCIRRNSGRLHGSVACEVPAVPIDADMPPAAPVVLHGAVLAIAPSDHSRCAGATLLRVMLPAVWRKCAGKTMLADTPAGQCLLFW
jgi:hypothetical protein